MTTLDIVPAVSVNGVEFGASRAIVEATFGQPAKDFKKTQWSKGCTADYGDFHLHYDAIGTFEAIEIFEAEVILPGGHLTVPTSKDAALRAVPSFKADEYGLTSAEESIGASVEDEKVSPILFGKPGYYA